MELFIYLLLLLFVMFISLINEITIMLISLLSYEHIYIYYSKEKILFWILSSPFNLLVV